MKARRKTVYLAGPLFTHAEWQWNAEFAGELRAKGYEVILPQDSASPMLAGEETFDAQRLFSENIAALERSDVVLAILDGADPDSGTAWECGYAFKAGTIIVGLRTDIRGGGDAPDGSVNLMLSSACRELVVVRPENRDDIARVAVDVDSAIRRAKTASARTPKR